MVKSGEKMEKTDIHSVSSNTVRATISFPANHYEQLERMASERKVSLAWMVRDAVDKYLRDQWPLLDSSNREGK